MVQHYEGHESNGADNEDRAGQHLVEIEDETNEYNKFILSLVRLFVNTFAFFNLVYGEIIPRDYSLAIEYSMFSQSRVVARKLA